LGGYLARRLLHSVLTLVGVSLAVFLVLRIIPGDPARLLLPEGASPDQIAGLRAKLGLDQPLPVQYVIFLRDAVRGDFGRSYQYDEPALGIALEKLPATAELTTYALLFAIVVAVPIGVLAAARRQTVFDYGTMVFAFLGQSMPSFWLGIMLILILAVGFRLLPTSGRGTWQHLIMPTLTLASFQMALIARLVRSSMLEVLREDYVRTARGKGLTASTVVFRHALRNGIIPVVTVVGLQFGTLLGGAVITETIFNWPGVGKLVIDAIYIRDYPIVQAVLVVSAASFVLINLLIDITYSYLDPRIRYS
jgi:ABC-type dipeptide/oligopeptide/nickel transport system permease component